MYIKVDESKISNEQLVAISEILGIPRLHVVLNVHYEVCKKEIECVIENSMDYIKEVVVYEGLVDFGNNKRKVLCAGVFLGSENNATNEKIKADFIALNQKLSVSKCSIQKSSLSIYSPKTQSEA